MPVTEHKSEKYKKVNLMLHETVVKNKKFVQRV